MQTQAVQAGALLRLSTSLAAGALRQSSGIRERSDKAAAELVKERFLLEVDADADISAAQASTVLD